MPGQLCKSLCLFRARHMCVCVHLCVCICASVISLQHAVVAAAAYTPAWRRAGLPAKPSQLQLDDAVLSSSKLLDSAAIIARQHAQQQREVLQPPAVFAYCDKSVEPHYLQTTGNQRVSPHQQQPHPALYSYSLNDVWFCMPSRAMTHAAS